MNPKLHSSFCRPFLALCLTAAPASAQTNWGTALALDGVDDYVSVAGAVNLANRSFTIEAWARRNTRDSFDVILGQGAGLQNQGLIFGFRANGLFTFAFYMNDVDTPATYTDADWHHWAGTYDAATKQRCIYRDGVLVTNATAAANYIGTGPLLIGNALPGVFPFAFDGAIDEVRVWSVARSQADISNHMGQSLTGIEPGLLAYYRFDEAAGTTAYDATPNHLDGTFVSRPHRVPSNWRPVVTLNSPNPLTNECHMPFVDPTTVNASPVAIAGGYWHSLALKADGSVVGWGANGSGQTTIPASATNGVVAIAAGDYHSLALKADGSVVAWGAGGPGQSGDPHYGQSTIPAGATNGVVVIAAGDYHSLALKADGSVVGWGRNDFGQTTIPAGATNGVMAIAAGRGHSLALKADGSVVGWGRDDFGQTTIPDGATNEVVAIAAGNHHSLALKANGSVVGWGWKEYDQTSIPASATNGVVAIAAGYWHSLALKADGSVVGWGYNAYGQATAPPRVYQLNLALSVIGTVDTNALGAYILTYSVTNALGAVGTANRTVVVADALPPVLTLLGDNPLLHELGTSFTDPAATAPDLCAGDLTESIVITDTVISNVPGSYTNTFTVTDASGNTAQTHRIVVVRDATPPVLTCPTNMVVVADPGQCEATVNFLAPSATDSVDPAPVVTCSLPSGSVLPVGRTNVLCTAWDASRNTNTCIFSISVYPYGFTPVPAGETWTARASNRAWRSVASSADGSKLVAAVDGGKIYTSTDSGRTWLPTSTPDTGWTCVGSSADGSTLLAGMWEGPICVSTDSGLTWRGRANAQRWWSVASSADGSKLVAAAQDGGQIHTSTDRGTNWTARDSGRNWKSVASSADGSKLVAGVWDGQLYTSSDSGTNWTARDTWRNWVAVASSADGTRLIAVVDGGPICISTNSGATWTQRESARAWSSVASSADGRRLVAVVNGGQIYTSEEHWPPPTFLGATNQVVLATAPGTGTTTYDATPNHLDGTLLWGPARVGSTIPLGGYALAFDGGDDYVLVPSGINLSDSSFTIEAWAQRDTTGSEDLILAQWTLNPLFLSFQYNNHFTFGFGGKQLDTPDPYTDTAWHHWAGTYDATTGRRCLYRDGILVTNDTVLGNYTGTGHLVIGSFEGFGGLDGAIDEVRIWNVARAANEIQASMNHPLAGTEPGLVAYYRFDEAAVATFNVTATNICQPKVPVTCTPPSGSTFPLGTNMVTCVAVDAFGVDTTARFTLVVRDVRPPEIVTQPASQEARPGTNVTLFAAATGAAPLTYQWRKNGTNLVDGDRIGGATNACLTMTNVVRGDSGKYSVTVTNAYGATNSGDATLWVTAGGHFTWETIASPQWTGAPFPVTVTARDESDTVDTYFTGTVALSGAVGGGQITGTIVGSGTHYFQWQDLARTAGYAFTPNTNLTVTHVRHYSGSKVSIWTDSGVLLAARTVTSVPGSWVETPLASPIQLTNGATYRVGVYDPDGVIYYGQGVAGAFPYGTIDQGYGSSGDAFPESPGYDDCWVVDLRYLVLFPLPVPVSPANSANFTNGVWSGGLTVLEPATKMWLVATHSAGYRGTSNPFDVQFRPPAPVFAGCRVAAPGQVRLQATGTPNLTYIVQTSTNLVNWVDRTNLVAGPGGLIECLMNIEPNSRAGFYRLRWP